VTHLLTLPYIKNKIYAEIFRLEIDEQTLLKVLVLLPIEEACDINWKYSFLSLFPEKQN
jgi:hypothetical protein